MIFQYPQKPSKWCLETSKTLQNEVSRGAWKHQNHKNIRKVKSNENHCIYYVFERLGHQKSEIFPIKNHQESRLQSKHAFWCLKSHELWKSDSKVTPTGLPQIIKNRWKSVLGHSRPILSAPLHPTITRMVTKWCLKTSRCLQNCVQGQSNQQILMKTYLKPILNLFETNQFLESIRLQLSNLLLQTRPAAGAKP